MPLSPSQLHFCLPGWSPSQLAYRHTFSSALADVRVSAIWVRRLGFSSSCYRILSRKVVFFPWHICTVNICTFFCFQRPDLSFPFTLLPSQALVFFFLNPQEYFSPKPLCFQAQSASESSYFHFINMHIQNPRYFPRETANLSCRKCVAISADGEKHCYITPRASSFCALRKKSALHKNRTTFSGCCWCLEKRLFIFQTTVKSGIPALLQNMQKRCCVLFFTQMQMLSTLLEKSQFLSQTSSGFPSFMLSPLA